MNRVLATDVATSSPMAEGAFALLPLLLLAGAGEMSSAGRARNSSAHWVSSWSRASEGLAVVVVVEVAGEALVVAVVIVDPSANVPRREVKRAVRDWSRAVLQGRDGQEGEGEGEGKEGGAFRFNAAYACMHDAREPHSLPQHSCCVQLCTELAEAGAWLGQKTHLGGVAPLAASPACSRCCRSLCAIFKQGRR